MDKNNKYKLINVVLGQNLKSKSKKKKINNRLNFFIFFNLSFISTMLLSVVVKHNKYIALKAIKPHYKCCVTIWFPRQAQSCGWATWVLAGTYVDRGRVKRL